MTSMDQENGESQEQQFEREQAWCVEQLELGLASSSKQNAKQAKEAVRVLKILKNPTTSMVKKRHAMRTTFGDYRTKMKQEEKKYLANAQKINLQAGSLDTQKKSTFLKKSTITKSEGKDSGFKFDFREDQDTDNSSKETESTLTTEERLDALSLNCGSGDSSATSEAQTHGSQSDTCENKPFQFKMEPSSNAFRFNFDGS